jgi:protein-tyrosine-phosphatase/DNA-binding transcriptional ArsR family regulator
MYRGDMVAGHQALPPPFLHLVGHPLRWQVLQQLAHSDLRVRELVTAIKKPQNLISYHLRQLRAGELVTTRRSTYDARDTYYHLDLTRCEQLLRQSASAIHPALRPRAPAPRLQTDARAEPVRVLFLCTGNSARSPMAAALLRHRAGDLVDAVSAGSHPKPLQPAAIRVLSDRYGIDLSAHQPTRLGALTDRRFDYVISLCDKVREVCPEFPGHPDVIHWSIPDPAASTEGTGTIDAAIVRTAAELDNRIRHFLPVLAARH